VFFDDCQLGSSIGRDLSHISRGGGLIPIGNKSKS